MQKITSLGEDLKKLLWRTCFHKGRTDKNGGHRDWLNQTGWGFRVYHYNHKLPAHLHPNGRCPHETEKSSSIINPYTGKEINIGIPYIFMDAPYFSLDLVSKSLTANDQLGVKLDNSNDGGIFFASPTGDSSIEKIGEELSFAYPKNLLGLQGDSLFETNDGEIQLLATSDSVNYTAYISLETVRNYMTKNGYFTDFSDNGLMSENQSYE